jgi:hypothetical protein
MNFKYFKNSNEEVYAFDIDDETQLPYMQARINEGFIDITDSWTPPEPVVFEKAKPTLESLQAQLLTLQEQITSLTNG